MRRAFVLAVALLGSGCGAPTPQPPPDSPPTPPPVVGVTQEADAPTPAAPASAPIGAVPGEWNGAGPAPRWMLRADSSLEARVRENRIPQLADARELSLGLRDAPSAEQVEGGLLLCDLVMPGTKMFKSRPDLRARFEVGEAPAAILDGHNNRDAVTVSLPLGRLPRGAQIQIAVYDRDLFTRDDFLDAASGTFPGHFPLILPGAARKLQATCRHLDAEALAPRLGAARAAAETAVAAWGSAVARAPDPAAFDFGAPWTAHAELEEAIDGVAALSGWRGEAVASYRAARTEGWASWEAAAEQAAEAAVAGALPASSAVTRADGLGVGPVALLCGGAAEAALVGTDWEQRAPDCVLRVAVRGAALSSLELPDGGRLELVFPGGRTSRLRFAAWLDGGAVYLSDEAPSAVGRSPLQDATALRISDGRAATFFLLR